MTESQFKKYKDACVSELAKLQENLKKISESLGMKIGFMIKALDYSLYQQTLKKLISASFPLALTREIRIPGNGLGTMKTQTMPLVQVFWKSKTLVLKMKSKS